MAKTKKPIGIDVLVAAKKRISYVFDNFKKVYISFSGGKDSTVMFHLVAEEAIKRNVKFGVLFIDLEAQYSKTIESSMAMFEEYKNIIDLHWCCLPIKLRNGVSNFEPTWCCWDDNKKDLWVRDLPDHKNVIHDPSFYPWFKKKMEFEEFIILWGEWYSKKELCAGFIGIRADESLNRFRTICTFKKETFNNKRWTTRIIDNLYNVYPIYDWKTTDIWVYHGKNKDKRHNEIYDMMEMAGVPLSKQRLCQPFGDDQRKGLWLYHILEPQTWYKLIARVNGANSGSLYIQETGNITGYNKISKPEGHTWKSFFMLLFSTMPKVTQSHYMPRLKSFVRGWKGRGYIEVIPDEAPVVLENKHWAPSWRRMCKVLLRNDWWCKGLGLTQPKSDAYGEFMKIKKGTK
jgi:predicted phosphoadenosine phosphosulfate sulfurtransferase